MKILLSAALAILTLSSPLFAKETKPKADLGDTLRQATIAVYHGKQECKDFSVEGFFGEPESEWGCKFQSRFICTATVIMAADTSYTGLTAGHCFDWSQKNEYFVSEMIGEKPVLRKITILKFENDERYDYAVFTFSSGKNYPAIPVELESTGPALGTAIANVNFAFGLVKQTTHGVTVSEMITTPAVHGTDSLKGRYLVNIGVGPGASGSAVVSLATGKIIGIVEAIFPMTQMPTVVMPTGQSIINFMEDDSAGIEPQKRPEPKAEVKAIPSFWDTLRLWLHLK